MSSSSATLEARATWRAWAGLAVLALPTLLVSLDIFVLLLALPQLSTHLGAGSSQQLWIMDVYGFMAAGFMITMGGIGDRIGRRRLLLSGAVLFGVASVIAAHATSPEMLIVARAVLGIAGAAVAPSTLSLIMNLFANPRQRATAIGIWVGCFVVGAIIGPVVGGAMLAHFWWGSVFLLGVPAMVLLLVLGPVLLPEYRNPSAGRLDLASVAMSLAAILPLVYGLKELARHGWQPLPIIAIVIGAVVAVRFARRQNALADPLLDLHLFTNPQFSISLGGLLSGGMLSGATMVFIAQHFQLVDGLSPLQAGLALLPGMATSIVSVQVAPLLARRVRPAFLIGAGLAVTAIGMLVITQSTPASGPTVLMIGFAIACLGSGPLVGLGTHLVMSSVPPEKAGSASGVVQTNSEFGYVPVFGCSQAGVSNDECGVPAWPRRRSPATGCERGRGRVHPLVPVGPSRLGQGPRYHRHAPPGASGPRGRDYPTGSRQTMHPTDLGPTTRTRADRGSPCLIYHSAHLLSSCVSRRRRASVNVRSV